MRLAAALLMFVVSLTAGAPKGDGLKVFYPGPHHLDVGFAQPVQSLQALLLDKNGQVVRRFDLKPDNAKRLSWSLAYTLAPDELVDGAVYDLYLDGVDVYGHKLVGRAPGEALTKADRVPAKARGGLEYADRFIFRKNAAAQELPVKGAQGELPLTYPQPGQLIGLNVDGPVIKVLGPMGSRQELPYRATVQTDQTDPWLQNSNAAPKGLLPGEGPQWLIYGNLDHGGRTDLKIALQERDGSKLTAQRTVYVDGFYYPQERTQTWPKSAFLWKTLGPGDKETGAKGNGSANWLDWQRQAGFDGHEPRLGPYDCGPHAKRIAVLYPDGSPNGDLTAEDEAGHPLAEAAPTLFKAPGSGRFFLRLKPVDSGRGFVKLEGNVEAAHLDEYQVQAIDGWANTPTSAAAETEFSRPANLVHAAQATEPGPKRGVLGWWRTTQPHRAGPATLRLRVRQDGGAWQEVDRARVLLGIPVGENDAEEVAVPEVYGRFLAYFTPQLLKHHTNVTLSSDEVGLVKPLPAPGYAKFSPIYEFAPDVGPDDLQLDHSHFNSQSNKPHEVEGQPKVVLQFFHSDEMFEFPRLRAYLEKAKVPDAAEATRDILRANSSLFQQLPDGTLVDLEPEENEDNHTWMAYTSDLRGRFLALPCKQAAWIEPALAASPYIFSPEMAAKGRGSASTTLRFPVYSQTSDIARVEVKVMALGKPGKLVATLMDQIRQQEDSPLDFQAGRSLVFKTAKPVEARWDGRDASGKLVPDGEYKFVVRLQDAIGLIGRYECSVFKKPQLEEDIEHAKKRLGVE